MSDPFDSGRDRDTGFIASSAIRYALGRRTYAGGVVRGWVLRHLHELDKDEIVRIAQEVELEVGRDLRMSEGKEWTAWATELRRMVTP